MAIFGRNTNKRTADPWDELQDAKEKGGNSTAQAEEKDSPPKVNRFFVDSICGHKQLYILTDNQKDDKREIRHLERSICNECFLSQKRLEYSGLLKRPKDKAGKKKSGYSIETAGIDKEILEELYGAQ